MAINAVAVIGAGVMGAAIAAHVANAGVKVKLLDIVKPGADNRNAIAEAAIERLKKTDPAPLMGRRTARLITPGNIEDDLASLNDVDWIVEAVLERLDIKQELYRKLDTVRKPGSIVSSNTSTIPLKELTAGLPESLSADFCITHFFNPPRYMRLLELVGGKAGRFADLVKFADERLGKSVVHCNDTPGFIANRIGAYWIQTAMVLALEMGLGIEQADAVMGKPLGFPATGVFGLMDLVGIDLGPHVNASLARLLPPRDAFHAMNRDTAIVERLIAEGYTGNKGKGGFYRSAKGVDGKRQKTVLDLPAAAQGRLEWRPANRAQIPDVKDAHKDLKNLLAADTKAGNYAWGVVGRVLAYAASLVPEISGSIADIDEAMRLGYTWRYGPFELIDRLGADWMAANLTRLAVPAPPILAKIGKEKFYRTEGATTLQFGPDGNYTPIPRPPGVVLLADIRRGQKPLLGNKDASLWDLGDGVLCFEIHAAAGGRTFNMIDGDIIGLIEKATALTAKAYKALVFHNDDPRVPPQNMFFSSGANLAKAQFAANIRMWSGIEKLIVRGQAAYRALRDAPFPVVCAPVGRALGGGCELLLYADHVQAYAECYIGLVETGVGLVPAWGGCAAMLSRWQLAPTAPQGPMPAVAKVFEIVSTAAVSRSAAAAKELLYLKPSDGVTMNRDRLLADAKAKALELAVDYAPPAPRALRLPGAAGRVGLQMVVEGFARRGIATPHDVTVAGHLAEVLTGGDTDIIDEVTEAAIMNLERKNFMALIRTKESLARIKSIVDTGKPLRN